MPTPEIIETYSLPSGDSPESLASLENLGLGTDDSLAGRCRGPCRLGLDYEAKTGKSRGSYPEDLQARRERLAANGWAVSPANICMVQATVRVDSSFKARESKAVASSE